MFLIWDTVQVLCDTYVTTDTGTGVVHQAPYFGEDDQRVCAAAGIVGPDSPVVCPVDASGRFTAEVRYLMLILLSTLSYSANRFLEVSVSI